MMTITIKDIHEAVLSRLLKKNSDPLRFSLRSKNKGNEERLSKGYWFLGNDDFLNFSFWDSKDWRNKTPSIFFAINAKGHCWIEFVDTDNSEKARFFEEIVDILGLQRHNKQDRFQWKKEYNRDSDYMKALEEFLKKDKPIIDAFIQAKSKAHLFPPIPTDKFEEYLSNIQEWREKVYPNTIGNTETQTNENQTEEIKKPLRLKRIILDNIGHFRFIDINLDQQVTCLIGENGSGKSSILRGIALGLATFDNTIIVPQHPAIQEMLRIEKIDGDEKVYASTGEIRVFYNEKDKNVINFKHIDGEESTRKGDILWNFNKADDEGSDFNATDGNHFVDLVLGFSQIKSLPEADKPAPDEDSKPRISEVTPLIYKRPDYCFDNFKAWIISLAEKKNQEKRAENLKVLESIFNVIKKIVTNANNVNGQTSLFELLPMKEDQYDIFIKTNDAPEGIPLDLISQGYNNVIGWVGHFMQRLYQVSSNSDFKNTPAICLIDEIDTYLHPNWQKDILRVLAAEFPNTQFIITTHSPLIIASLKKDFKIYKISKIDGLMMTHEHYLSGPKGFKPYAAKSSRILSEIMNTKERPAEVQQLINDYGNAIVENDFEEAERIEKQLKELLDPKDPDIIDGEASIEARKMLQEI